VGSTELLSSIDSSSSYDDYWREFDVDERRIVRALTASGIVLFNRAIPAPFFEDSFINRLTQISHKKRVFEPEKRGKDQYGREVSTREVLEKIVSELLGEMGFSVDTNVKLDTRGGGKVEVDIWDARKLLVGTFMCMFRARIGKRGGRQVIDGEFGRVQQLIQMPHLKVLVVGKLTDPARREALADGFIVIELGEKASADNAGDIYEVIYGHLRELFVEMAPPELQKLAEEARKIFDKLREMAEKLSRIAGTS